MVNKIFHGLNASTYPEIGVNENILVALQEAWDKYGRRLALFLW